MKTLFTEWWASICFYKNGDCRTCPAREVCLRWANLIDLFDELGIIDIEKVGENDC